LGEAASAVEILDRLPGARARWLNTGCCGMAGAFGMMREHRRLSHQVAEPLLEAISTLPRTTRLVASGTSCRHQIEDLTDHQPLHFAELLAAHVTAREP
jgi:Fe-S oxidoreductase